MVKSQHNVTLNIELHEIDSRFLRLGGATTLLCTKVDRDFIQLQGCWKSNAMIRHLHISVLPWVNKFAEQMLKAAILPFCHRSARMARPRTMIQTQMTCPIIILILPKLIPWQNNPVKPLIPLPFHL